MIDQDDVAARDAHRAYRHAVRAVQRGQADRERERVGLAPPHADDGLLEQRVDGLLDRRQAHRLTVPRVGVGGGPGARAAISSMMMTSPAARCSARGRAAARRLRRPPGVAGPRVDQRGRRGPGGQAALPVAPGPEVHFAVCRVDHHLGGDERLEDLVGARHGGAQVGPEQGLPREGEFGVVMKADVARLQRHRPGIRTVPRRPRPGRCSRRAAGSRSASGDGAPRSAAAPSAGTPRCPPRPGSSSVRRPPRTAAPRWLCRGPARGFLPGRHDQGQPVRQQLPEAGEVLGQVGQVRLGQDRRRAGLRGGAVEPVGHPAMNEKPMQA